MSKTHWIVLVALLALLLLYGGLQLASNRDEAPARAPEPETERPGTPEADAALSEAPPGEGPVPDEPPAPAEDEGGASGSEVEPAADAGAGAGETSTRETEAEPSPPPAVRPNRRTPPPPRPGTRPLGGRRPPMGPTGLWEKFPPEIPRGDAELAAAVLDVDGAPVEGAKVYIGPPDAAGSSAVSFGDLREVGVTDARGRVRAGRLPEGSACVAANLDNLLNGPRGLDARTAVRTVLKPHEAAEVEVRLPFSLSEFGGVRGVVVDAEGQPLRNASVSVDFSRVRTGRDGAFEIPRIRPGAKVLSASRSGYAAARESVEVAAGDVAEVKFVLEYQERGSMDLQGSVVGPEGEPVPGATVYLGGPVRGGQGTIRSAETDASGRFRMDSLPDRLAEVEVKIQASKMGEYSAGIVLFPDGLNVAEVEIRMPARLTKLVLLVTDARTSNPLTRCRFFAGEPGTGKRVASFSSRSETGRYETPIRAGIYDFLVEAPDHEAHSARVEIPSGGGEFSYLARLAATGDPSREVVLTVVVRSAVDRRPIERAKVEVVPRDGEEPVAALEGERPEGRFVLPVPAAEHRLRVSAKGFQPAEVDVDLRGDSAEFEVEALLYPE